MLTRSNEQCCELLERKGILHYNGRFRSAAFARWTDASGNDLWSVNIVVGDEDGSLIDERIPMLRYTEHP